MEYTIGSTNLRQQLTDVLEVVREQGVAYVIETFGRPQAVLINLEDYRQFCQFEQERKAFFTWLDEAAAQNAKLNSMMSEAEVLALIEQARVEVATQG